VRAIAVAGGRLHAEQLIELLWADVDPLTGRSRLRNLLNRVRAAGGELLIRERDTIAFAPGTEIDADLFERQAPAAMAADDRSRAEALARAALERYLGELLPEDRYEPWAAARRERLAARRLELLDLLAASAQARADTDEATRLLERAIDAEPYDEHRYLLLARLLASQGRSGSALAVLRRATAALAELALEPSPALRELELALGGRAEA
jgi:DNA-binding SARP family transcriptional activator